MKRFYSFHSRKGLSPAEGRKILIMGAFLVVLLAFFTFFMIRSLSRPQEEGPQTTSEKTDWVKPSVYAEKEIELPSVLAERIKEETEEQRVIREREPFLFLFRATQRASWTVMSHRGFEEVTPRQLRGNPGAYRAKRVSIRGTLKKDLEFEKELLPGAKNKELFIEGRIVTEEGEHVVFSLFKYPDQELLKGEQVSLKGIFFKNYLTFDEDEKGEQVTVEAPYIIGKRLLPYYEYVPVTELDPNILDAVEDETSTDALLRREGVALGKKRSIWETKEFLHVLNYTRNLTPETFEKIKPEAVTSLDLAGDSAAEFRGKMISFRCMLQALWKVPLEDNPADAPCFYYGLASTGERKMVTIMFSDRDKPTGVELLDYVEITGVFFKKFAFESEEQTLVVNPLVIGKSIRKLEYREPFAFKGLMIAVSIAIGVLALFFLIILFGDKKQTSQFRSFYSQKRKKQTKGMDLNSLGRKLSEKVRSDREKKDG